MILLQLSAVTFLIPVAYFLLYTAKKYALATALIVVCVSSQLFWRNPVENSTTHCIDALIAKITIFGFILYTVSYTLCTIHRIISYAAIMVITGITALVGDRYSSNKWCSSGHIYSHAMLHLFGTMGAMYAFL
jgi:hypothetical protein